MSLCCRKCVPVLHSAVGGEGEGAGNVKQTWSRLLQVGMSGCTGCSLIFELATFPRMKRSQTNLGGWRGAVAICLLLCRAQVKGAEPGSLLFTGIILVNGWRGVPEGSLVSVGVKDSWPNVCVSNRLKKVAFVLFFFTLVCWHLLKSLVSVGYTGTELFCACW